MSRSGVSRPEAAVPATQLARPTRPVLASLGDYMSLSKPRVSALVWATTLAGIILAGGGSFWLYFHMLVGSWLVIASANAFNQVLESGPDAAMSRTRCRPIPAGRLTVVEAASAALAWAVLGVTELALFVSPGVAALGLVALALYALAYTPLKTRTHLCTVVGALPGAVPPLAGWMAVRGGLEAEALVLFGIQFVWQFPHFWAIAWLLREDYRRVGFKMLPFPGAGVRATGLLALGCCLALIPISWALGSYLSNRSGYLVAATVVGLGLALCGLSLATSGSDAAARRLLKATLIYLPLLLLLAIITR